VRGNVRQAQLNRYGVDMNLMIRSLIIVFALALTSCDKSTDLTADDIQTLAETVRADEVVMYTTSSCPYGAQAASWLRQHGFAYTECNMSTTPACEQAFLAHGGDGTPYLIVRGHHMKDGFDSDEFLAALR